MIRLLVYTCNNRKSDLSCFVEREYPGDVRIIPRDLVEFRRDATDINDKVTVVKNLRCFVVELLADGEDGWVTPTSITVLPRRPPIE